MGVGEHVEHVENIELGDSDICDIQWTLVLLPVSLLLLFIQLFLQLQTFVLRNETFPEFYLTIVERAK